jgi:hypothetical protein
MSLCDAVRWCGACAVYSLLDRRLARIRASRCSRIRAQSESHAISALVKMCALPLVLLAVSHCPSSLFPFLYLNTPLRLARASSPPPKALRSYYHHTCMSYTPCPCILYTPPPSTPAHSSSHHYTKGHTASYARVSRGLLTVPSSRTQHPNNGLRADSI